MKVFTLGFLFGCFCILSGQWVYNQNTKVVEFEGIEYRRAYEIPSDSCWKWALGEDVFIISLDQIDEEWNKRHEDIFHINGYDLLNETYDRIARACEERGIE